MTTHRVFITGTDTGVGKTHFTTWLARRLRGAGYSVGAYKPVCSGASAIPGRQTWDDAERLAAALGGEWPLERVAPQCYTAPLAPPVAAALESRDVDEKLLISGADWWEGRVDVLLIEGAGGWFSPVSTLWTNADLAVRLNAPVILVAGHRLGVINHALLSIGAIRTSSELLGVVLNECAARESPPWPGFDAVQSNAGEIERRAGLPLLGILGFGADPVMHPEHGTPRDWGQLLNLDPPGRPRH